MINLEGRVVILDPGHYALKTNVYKGYDEQVAMLSLALKIKPLLEKSGATVLLTRSDGSTVTLAQRAAMVNVWSLEALYRKRIDDYRKNFDTNFSFEDAMALESADYDLLSEDTKTLIAELKEIQSLINVMRSIIDDADAPNYMNDPYCPDRTMQPLLARIFEIQEQGNAYLTEHYIFISLHSNGTPEPIDESKYGANVFYVSNSNQKYARKYACEKTNMVFGDILLEQIEKTGIANKGLMEANFYVIREHNIPGVLAENGFHTNDADREKLLSEDYLQSLAVSYHDAIQKYFRQKPL